MEAVAEALWAMADSFQMKSDIAKSVKCLEAICQSSVSFLPIVEVKTRIRIASLLLRHTHNVNQAKFHLERSQLLLKSIPSCFELKCRVYSLLSHCYHLIGSIPPQKQILNKALDLVAASSNDGIAGKLWFCNFSLQLANALIIDGDYQNAISALKNGYNCAAEICYPELQMFFTSSILHVNLMQWPDSNSILEVVTRCDEIWESIEVTNRQRCFGLLVYHDLLNILYQLRICDYKKATQHAERLDAAVKDDMQRTENIQMLTGELNALEQILLRSDLQSRRRSEVQRQQLQLQEQIRSLTRNSTSQGLLDPTYNDRALSSNKVHLAPAPLDGEWLPKTAIYALVDLVVIICGRPKGLFKECAKRIQSAIKSIQDELEKLGIIDSVREVDLQHSSIWMAGLYLMLLMQFLEHKVAVELTRTEFVQAQEALVQMRNLYIRFPTILQACASNIEILRGQYAHSTGCFSEATFHFIEAAKLTDSNSIQAMCQVYTAISYLCIGDAESSSQVLDLIGPVYRTMDSFIGVREKTSVLFAYGLLLMKQHNLQEARIRLATGLQITHNTLGNLQLVSQYLTILGSLALALRDTGQAREILRSALTLAKKLYDVPTQIWVLSVLTTLYQELGERGNQMENAEFQKQKVDDLHKKLAEAHSSIHHLELIDKVKLEVPQLHELDRKRSTHLSMGASLDIPESIGLRTPAPAPSSSRLMDLDSRRRGKRKL